VAGWASRDVLFRPSCHISLFITFFRCLGFCLSFLLYRFLSLFFFLQMSGYPRCIFKSDLQFLLFLPVGYANRCSSPFPLPFSVTFFLVWNRPFFPVFSLCSGFVAIRYQNSFLCFLVAFTYPIFFLGVFPALGILFVSLP